MLLLRPLGRAGAGALPRGAYARVLASLAPSEPPRRVLEHQPSLDRPPTRRAANDPFTYTLQVFTGDRRGASTSAQVHATLIGSESAAGPFALVGEFQRATRQSFCIQASAPIGSLQRVSIGHDATDVGAGWFLEKVTVDCHASGLVYEFRCDAWLGESDSGGAAGPLNVELVETQSAQAEFRRRAAARAPHSGGALQLTAMASTLPRTDKLRKGQRARMGGGFGWGGEDAYCITPAPPRTPPPLPPPPAAAAAASGGAAPGGAAGGAAGAAARGHRLLGVADGVGSWGEQGIDAGKYARALVQASLEHFEAVVAARTPATHSGSSSGSSSGGGGGGSSGGGGGGGGALVHSLQLSAVAELVARASKDACATGVQGSSTLCLVHVDCEAASLTAANLGDSGFLILRNDGGVAYRSAQQEHSFGCPFQLGHHAASSSAADAQLAKLHVCAGDVIVLGSDGLFDNLSDAAIAREVKAAMDEVEATGRRRDRDVARDLANRLVEQALTASLDRLQDTPFARAATEEFGLVYRGGKEDDITVVVGLLFEAEEPH